MNEMNAIKEQLRTYIVGEFLPGESPENLKDETPLRTSGVLDSMSTLQLIGYVEEHFNITVEAHEADIENFDRIEDMASFIAMKGAGKAWRS